VPWLSALGRSCRLRIGRRISIAERPHAYPKATRLCRSRNSNAAQSCALREAGGDKLAAARLLGIGKATLYRKLKEYETGSHNAGEGC
jgi:sigma-54 dependent transcriptional regulator, acetoin dehydrogenase operon transcriptional activator AcoR